MIIESKRSIKENKNLRNQIKCAQLNIPKYFIDICFSLGAENEY